MEIYNKSVKKYLENTNLNWSGFNGEYVQDNKFYLNKTCLGAFLRGVLYVSGNSITSKCSQYIKELIAVASSMKIKVVEIPQFYYTHNLHHEFTESGIITAFEDAVNKIKDNRDVYSKSVLEKYKKAIHELWFKVPESLENTITTALTEIEKVLEVEESEFKELLEKHSYYELAQIAFFREGQYSGELRTKLRKYLNPTGEYAFLRADADGWTYSSECKCGLPKKVMTLEETKAITKAWFTGTARHGQKYGKYTIMKVMDGYIQVSCNRYCKAMFDALYFEVWK